MYEEQLQLELWKGGWWWSAKKEETRTDNKKIDDIKDQALQWLNV